MSEWEEQLTIDGMSVYESVAKVNGVHPCYLVDNATGQKWYYVTETAYTDACRDMSDFLVEKRYR